MERHSEIVRQWRILLALEGRARPLSLRDLQQAAGEGVSERTIRRDLNALAQAGFPIEPTRVEGRTQYTLNREVFGGLASAGFSLSELCALYLSRTMLSALAGAPFHESLTSAFDKLTDALPPALWRFIDQLPQALAAKAPPLRAATAAPRLVDALLGAILAHRRVRMRYHSFASQQVKDYVVEPYRVAYAQGTLYVFAFVPAYGEMRTFAVQRVEDVPCSRRRSIHGRPAPACSPIRCPCSRARPNAWWWSSRRPRRPTSANGCGTRANSWWRSPGAACD